MPRASAITRSSTNSSAGYDLNSADDKGYTALIPAAYNGHGETVERLLAAGADACAEDKRGNTALLGAIFKGELGIAKRLLATECDPNQRNNAGRRRRRCTPRCSSASIARAARAWCGPECGGPVGQQRGKPARGEIRTR